MFSALDNNNHLIDIDTAIQNISNKYFCPSCHEELIIKNGSIRIQHFAHKNNCDCDDYDNDMSEWHRNWQKKFPLKNREVVLKLDNDDPFAEDYKKTIRRTDVLCYGYAIEFQNSPISNEEFEERTMFYNRLGKKVVWVFNMIEGYKSGRIKYCDEWLYEEDNEEEDNEEKSNGGEYIWKYASKTFVGYDSDNKDVILLFQFAEVRNNEDDKEQNYFERITWAINSRNDYKHTDFKIFCTSYYPSNFTKLMEKLKKEYNKMV